MNRPALHLYVDGSFDPALEVGGWGLVVVRDGEEVDALSGGKPAQDNSAMELEAILAAMLWIEKNAFGIQATIWSDAVYAVNGCNSGRHIWKSNAWKRRTSNGKGRTRAIPNSALWKRIDHQLVENPSISVIWCKGHVGVAWNEKAHRLAEQGRLS